MVVQFCHTYIAVCLDVALVISGCLTHRVIMKVETAPTTAWCACIQCHMSLWAANMHGTAMLPVANMHGTDMLPAGWQHD